eukprot:scpid56468/ scgid7071/ 
MYRRRRNSRAHRAGYMLEEASRRRQHMHRKLLNVGKAHGLKSTSQKPSSGGKFGRGVAPPVPTTPRPIHILSNPSVTGRPPAGSAGSPANDHAEEIYDRLQFAGATIQRNQIADA